MMRAVGFFLAAFFVAQIPPRDGTPRPISGTVRSAVASSPPRTAIPFAMRASVCHRSVTFRLS
jgi:hypothetical protein